MKISRLRSGYRIKLSDGEFEAICHMLALAESDLEGDETRAEQADLLSLAGKRALLSDRFLSRTMMQVDEDRR